MGIYVGTLASGPTASLILDLQSLTSRVANMLQRSDLNTEIEQWLNFVQRDLAKEIKIKDLLVTAAATTLLPMPLPPVAGPEGYFLYDLPADFSMPDKAYYQSTTDATNKWGRNLVPLPRRFYAGDVVDLERLLNVSAPIVGDPYYYWIDKTKFGIYPALANNLTGTVQLTYYKIPADMTVPSHEPVIPNQYRHYMIWLALLWGKAMLEKEDITKVAYWQKQYDNTTARIGRFIRKSDVVRETLNPPGNGMEWADEIY